MCISVKFSGDAESAVLRPLPYEKSRCFMGRSGNGCWGLRSETIINLLCPFYREEAEAHGC